MSVKKFETLYAGRPLTIEVGKTSCLANGSCWVTYGETVVMANVTMADKPRDGVDFFPLSVDYEEKLYSVGRIPGSYIKRESRPSEKAILTSRAVDRPFRPFFPKDMRNDVSIVMTVLSNDGDNSPEITAMLAASVAVAVSDIPFNSTIASISVGLVDGQIVLNPTAAQRAASDLDLTVAAHKEKVVMIEAGAKEVPDALMLDCIKAGHEEIKKFVDFIDSIAKEVGLPKSEFPSMEVPSEIFDKVKAIAEADVKIALDTDDKNKRDAAMLPIYENVHGQLDEVFPEQIAVIDEAMYKLQKYIVRNWLKNDKKRVDGRGIDEIRPLSSEVGLLPRVHGSGLFSRGQTQVLAIATLAPVSESQRLDGIDEDTEKRYMHHYNFPSYSVGETRPSRGPGRREIGHGALAERAILPVIPEVEDFPYAIRVVSEVVSSNGSTSQGAICGSTLALMDAGVPLKAPVAGISCGLIQDGDEFMTMVDIQGLEDFFGDMDFKVGGTKKGITAIQVDIKTDGLSYEVIEEAFAKTKTAREYILDEVMLKAIAEPREELSKYAPKMLNVKIPVDKIAEVIGKSGKVIQKICADYDVKVDVEEDGNVFVSCLNVDKGRAAINVIKTIAFNPEIGTIFKGKVVKIMPFGAFVEIAPGKDGMCHVSKLDFNRVENVEDVVSEGDEIVVKVMEIDSQGRINLSRKDALAELQAKAEQNAE
jgi:polyribonucleotide nucleotidyltransferase